MPAKPTSGNRLTLTTKFPVSCWGAKYLDVTEGDGRIVLTPVRIDRAGAAQAGRQ